MYNQWSYSVDFISFNIPTINIDLCYYYIPNPSNKAATQIQLKPAQQPLFINLHDNEKTSVQAALDCIQQHNYGHLLELSHKKNRLISLVINNYPCQFDPNRIFTDTGIESTLKKYHCFSENNFFIAKQFSDIILQQIKTHNFPLLIALHNNENKAGNKENYNILSYYPHGDEAENTEDLYHNQAHCPDDFFITTERSLFNYIKNKKFNIILHKTTGVNDGSLSYYCALNKISYINVEARHGHYHQQQQMISLLFQYLESK
ncbi:hypothetical protein PsalN5692_02220 [Piscirickettsia salmonis]|uniref:hypothetical protein n=1 Tax=Piscirickettsia salmonis TaxID=1238 RepID=UPI0012B72C4D|nr:hypothetical protein [Piscirickettsia salmonis]QGP50749.1 hypothetical protein PsalN5692_02220 [Piscirickettsia salmonis]